MSEIKLVNLTPHTLHIHGGETVVTLPSSGIARAHERRTRIGTLAGLPLTHIAFGDIEGLPDPTNGVILVVSRIVAEAVPERDDVLFPGSAIRDDEGRIVGCHGLSRACDNPARLAGLLDD